MQLKQGGMVELHGPQRPVTRCSRHNQAACQRWPGRRVASSSAEHPVPEGAALGRRQLLGAGAAVLGAPLLLATPPAMAAGAPETFMSSEGFAFEFPADWVVAFDRSTTARSKPDGAVVVVGNFRSFDTASVFRVEVPAADAGGALTEELGYRLAVQPQQQEASTMRFQLLSSSLTPAGAGGRSAYYDYEYQIETCRGEIIEAAGGVIECLGPQGQDLQTLRRHHVGRALVVNGYLYALNTSAPVDRWAGVEATLTGIMRSFRC